MVVAGHPLLVVTRAVIKDINIIIRQKGESIMIEIVRFYIL
jgi:hypothetical protein